VSLESVATPEGLRFDAEGLIPAVVQEVLTGEVLMVAWMNGEALGQTLRARRTHFWSRSRQTLWRKGDTSGHAQHVEAVYTDCDRDALLVLVHQEGVACHTGSRTCFFAALDGAGDPPPGPAGAPEGPVEWASVSGILDTLDRLIQRRRIDAPERSYVGRLLAGGDVTLAGKIGEEATEVVVAALTESPERLVSEVADLWFHTLVLLGAHGLSPRQVLAELARRHEPAQQPPDRGAPGPTGTPAPRGS
jgi:phosphoribosyl-ATP pyrophosphohydrolase/phosphoribosyl-AMP cyclohydrolase